MEAFAGVSSTSDRRVRSAPRSQGRLRLLEVGLSWPPETFVMLKLRYLAESGVDVLVGSFPAPEMLAPEPAGIKVQTLPGLGSGRRALGRFARDLMRLDGISGRAVLSTLPWRLPLRLWRLYLHLVRARADVLHFEWLSVATRCLPLLRVWDGPIVISCRGSELPTGEPLSNQSPPSVLRAVFARADAVHVVSEAKRDQAVAQGLDPSKASLIRTGVDAQFFRPPTTARADTSRFSVVSVGWLRWLKGYEDALLAISELARQDVPVTLDILGGDPPEEMGEPSQRERILYTVRDLDLEGRVVLHGHVPPSEVCEHLHRADALLHASVTEGLPNAVVEAMACGLPVVATDVGGTSEALRDGVDGFLVPPRDPEATAAALRSLWRDAGLRAQMGRAGRARVEAEFTIERQTTKWLELYERVTGVG